MYAVYQGLGTVPMILHTYRRASWSKWLRVFSDYSCGGVGPFHTKLFSHNFLSHLFISRSVW